MNEDEGCHLLSSLLFYEISTEPQNTYGVIAPCYSKCATCRKGEENIDGEIKMNCDTCISSLYQEKFPSTNCISDSENNLGIDISNSNDKKCGM